MKRIYKLSYLLIFIFIFNACKPTIDRANYPLLFSLFNSKNSTSNSFSLSYPQTSFSFAVDVTISAISPVANGTISSCSVTPSLPSGLFLDSSCVISGAPTTILSFTGFTVTATSSSSTATTGIQIEVVSIPSALNYGGPYIFTVGSGITTITPTVTGTVSSYSISPDLPSGLNFNSTTGEISGIPSALSTITSYTVFASNAAGTTTYSFDITVNDAPPSGFSYAGNPFSFTEYQTVSNVAPTITGNITSCTGALPAGLTLEPTTCKIIGTPTTPQAGSNYTITASNSGGSVNVTINIAIIANPNKKIFVTSSLYSPGVQFNSPASADTLCNSDAGKPLGSGTYKAMIVTALVRVACLTSNCSAGPTEHLDWIFQPNTTYYQNDGVTPIATTNGNGLMPGIFTNSVSPSSSEYWTGLSSVWTTALNNCANWTTGAAQSTGGGFTPNNTTGLFTDSLGAASCATARKLLCVQQ